MRRTMNQFKHCGFRFRGTISPLVTVMVLFSLISSSCCEALPSFPAAVGPVNDFAGIIPADSEERMNRLSQEVLEKTGTAIVVATVEDTGDNEPAMYANELYQAWGIGKKGEDKGILILLAVQERQIRIETGYGVEGILPDGLVGKILDRFVIPALKEGDYGTGMENAVSVIARVVARDAGVTLTGNPSAKTMSPGSHSARGNILPPIILFLLIIALLGTRQGRAMLPYLMILLLSGGRRGGGGGFGGFGGGYGGFGGGASGGGGAGRGF